MVTINPMHPTKNLRFDTSRLNEAPRCRARSKRSGKQCRAPAVRGKHVCRMHGGARGSGAPRGMRNGNFKTGTSTKEGLGLMRHLNFLARALRKLK
jgi:glucans biosynthesis protein